MHRACAHVYFLPGLVLSVCHLQAEDTNSPHGTVPEVQREDLAVLSNCLGFLLNPKLKQGPRAECTLQIQVQRQFPSLSALFSMWVIR